MPKNRLDHIKEQAKLALDSAVECGLDLDEDKYKALYEFLITELVTDLGADAMAYKDFLGSVEYDIEDKVYHGRITNIDALVTYEAETEMDLYQEFVKAAIAYMETK